MKLFKYAITSEEQEVDSLISQLLTGQSSSISSANIPNHSQGFYQLPVKVGKTGKSIDEGDRPWIVGTFLPKQYVNDTHPEGHNGVDLKAPKGTPIYPIGPGTVTEAKEYPKGGKTCKIAHEDGILVSYYAHMDFVNARPGQKVTSDDVIGYVGATGNARGVNHCHLEVKLNGSHIDPFSVIGKSIGIYSK